MAEANKILAKMLDRLLAGLVNGPSLNCRPYASRQRLDLVQLGKLGDVTPENVLRALLESPHDATIKARTPLPKSNGYGNGKRQKLKVAESIEAADEQGVPLADGPVDQEAIDEARAPEHAWLEQQAVLNKLHTIAEDAKTYEQDTGVSVLNVGFPLLSLPPGAFGGGKSNATKRVMAPLAFIPVAITVKRGAAPAIELAHKGEGVDLVLPNAALFAWLEQQTGKSLMESDPDEAGQHPWLEICEIVQAVCSTIDIAVPALFKAEKIAMPKKDQSDSQVLASSSDMPGERGGEGKVQDVVKGSDASALQLHREKESESPESDLDHPENTIKSAVSSERKDTREPPVPGESDAVKSAIAQLVLRAAPKSDESDDAPQIICSAVLGLFPMANQGLLRDTQAMLSDEHLAGPIESFIRLGVSLDVPAIPNPTASVATASTAQSRPVVVADERFISGSDPCQAQAVRLARESRGLVVHGPPGTGKSQTITNIIGDHLARGERVLVVCDKRTALDVVFNRLNHMGLGNLCALVHDPRRDQRELYKSIRQQLDDLSAAKTNSRARAKLATVDVELQALHDELTQYRAALVRRQGDHAMNFHELVGEWLSLADFAEGTEAIDGVSMQTLDTYTSQVQDVLRRGQVIAYGVNPWVAVAGISLGDFLAQSMEKIRSSIRACEEAARSADATIDPVIPPFVPGISLRQQAEARTSLAEAIPRVIASVAPEILARWASESVENLTAAKQKIDSAQAFVETFQAGPMDAEVLANVRNQQLDSLPIGQQLAKLAAYQEIAQKWYAFLPLRAKTEAAGIVNGYGMTLSAAAASRVEKFITALRARLELSTLMDSFVVSKTPSPATSGEPTLRDMGKRTVIPNIADASQARVSLFSDDILGKLINGNTIAINLMLKIQDEPALCGLLDRIAMVLREPAGAGGLLEGLHKSPPRAAALEKLEEAATNSRLFDPAWLNSAATRFRGGEITLSKFMPLRERVESLEGVLRIRQGLNVIPVKLRAAVITLLNASVEADRAGMILRREALAGEISARLLADPQLHEIDGHRLESAFSRYRELDEKKRGLTRDVIQHQWISRQQDRLLAQSRSRMNSLGADLRRRLMLRGERAMRLRQVVAIGSKISDGDPLFDLAPIWLCSPETVAQIFPREPVFDVLVFDEASQLRLEESLPVLVRAKRVVIAGDPKQLPPTRFFESAVAASNDDDAQSDQELFDQQQGEIEDLLAAALGLDIQQCYLDVHYRSRHPELIAFSNQHFYNSRLQPIPARPSADHSTVPAVILDQVGGVYAHRCNESEALRIVEIVKDLLARPEPPSIGIACFNLVQRDRVAEKLDELATEDATFARRLEIARGRQGEGSFEGLFVKNLENVQGDERDYILISTTYGPDAAGNFYRRFGPLGRAGGGRRLNVLITRARDCVHVVTSIPREAYHTLPALEPGQAPGGTWLLLAYLNYAERLQPVAGPRVKSLDSSDRFDSASAAITNSQKGGLVLAKPQAVMPAQVNVLPAKSPSSFAQALALHLAKEGNLASDVHWGNEGFCVDLAIRNAMSRDDVSVGILCDATRFAGADDPMQWDVFRTGILESQGWKLHRVWTPHFFRDPKGIMQAIVSQAGREVDSVQSKDQPQPVPQSNAPG